MSVTQNEKAIRYRALRDGPGAFVIPNPWDVGILSLREWGVLRPRERWNLAISESV
jgi:hypothetical protein